MADRAQPPRAMTHRADMTVNRALDPDPFATDVGPQLGWNVTCTRQGTASEWRIAVYSRYADFNSDLDGESTHTFAAFTEPLGFAIISFDLDLRESAAAIRSRTWLPSGIVLTDEFVTTVDHLVAETAAGKAL